MGRKTRRQSGDNQAARWLGAGRPVRSGGGAPRGSNPRGAARGDGGRQRDSSAGGDWSPGRNRSGSGLGLGPAGRGRGVRRARSRGVSGSRRGSAALEAIEHRGSDRPGESSGFSGSSERRAEPWKGRGGAQGVRLGAGLSHAPEMVVARGRDSFTPQRPDGPAGPAPDWHSQGGSPSARRGAFVPSSGPRARPVAIVTGPTAIATGIPGRAPRDRDGRYGDRQDSGSRGGDRRGRDSRDRDVRYGDPQDRGPRGDDRKGSRFPRRRVPGRGLQQRRAGRRRIRVVPLLRGRVGTPRPEAATGEVTTGEVTTGWARAVFGWPVELRWRQPQVACGGPGSGSIGGCSRQDRRNRIRRPTQQRASRQAWLGRGRSKGCPG